MPSLYPTFTEAVGKVGRGTGQGTRGVGRRPEANGQVSGRNGPGSANNYTASVQTTQPGQIPVLVAELERLRAQVKEMETEREEARKKRSRSLSVPSPDLVGGPDLLLQEWGALHDEHVVRGKGAIMEMLISRGSTLAASSNRISPLA